MKGTLRTRRQYDLVYGSGLKAVGRHLVAFVLRSPEGAEGAERAVGVVASRRVGSAAARNRAKRLLREAFRGFRPQLAAPLWIVLVARASIVESGVGLHEVVAEMETLLRRLDLLGEGPARDGPKSGDRP